MFKVIGTVVGVVLGAAVSYLFRPATMFGTPSFIEYFSAYSLREYAGPTVAICSGLGLVLGLVVGVFLDRGAVGRQLSSAGDLSQSGGARGIRLDRSTVLVAFGVAIIVLVVWDVLPRLKVHIPEVETPWHVVRILPGLGGVLGRVPILFWIIHAGLVYVAILLLRRSKQLGAVTNEELSPA